MKRRSGEIQVFSMSFLDVLSCALGGTLLLLLLIQEGQQQETESREQAMKQMLVRIESAQREMQQAIQQAEEARKKADNAQREADEAARRAKTAQQRAEAAKKQAEAAKQRAKSQAKTIARLKRAQDALVGLGGKKENIVFIFDTSGSMQGPNFSYYVGHLVKLIKNLEFKRFNVVEYDNRIRIWRPGQLVDGSVPANRAAAEQFTKSFKADGLTDTMGALQAAARLPGVDTIILFSDGAPLPPRILQLKTLAERKAAVKREMESIKNWARSKRGSLTVNTISIGGEHTAEHRMFLRQLAELSGGTAQALP